MNIHKYRVDDSLFNIIQGLGDGDVYLGINDYGTVAALKYIHSKDHQAQKKFMSEMSTLCSIKYPCIIPFIGYSLDSLNKFHLHSLCIITEYIPNDSLKAVYQKIREGNIPEGWNSTAKSKIAFGIAAGMEYLHRNNISHLNLSPNSILLDFNLEPKISGLGASQNEKSIYSFKYTAPDLLGGSNHDNTRFSCDIYSYAVILCTLTNESFPQFDSKDKIKSYKEAKNFILEGKRYLINENTPNKLRELIQNCWHQKYIKRPTFTDIVKIYRGNDNNVLKNYCFEGTDIEELKRYINSIPPIDNLLSAKASVSSTTAVESRPSSRPGAISISAAPVRGRKQKPRTHGKLG